VLFYQKKKIEILQRTGFENINDENYQELFLKLLQQKGIYESENEYNVLVVLDKKKKIEMLKVHHDNFYQN